MRDDGGDPALRAGSDTYGIGSLKTRTPVEEGRKRPRHFAIGIRISRQIAGNRFSSYELEEIHMGHTNSYSGTPLKYLFEKGT